MKRRKSLGLLLVVAMLLATIGMAPVQAQTETLLVWATTELTGDLEVLGEQFEAEFGIAVDVQEVGFGDMATDLLNFGPAGEGPDILVTENSRLGALVENGALMAGHFSSTVKYTDVNAEAKMQEAVNSLVSKLAYQVSQRTSKR